MGVVGVFSVLIKDLVEDEEIIGILFDIRFIKFVMVVGCVVFMLVNGFVVGIGEDDDIRLLRILICVEVIVCDIDVEFILVLLKRLVNVFGVDVFGGVFVGIVTSVSMLSSKFIV